MGINLHRPRLKTAAIAAIVIVALLVLEGFLWAHASVPQTRGTIRLKALTEDVEIVRDNYGVPHIFAPDWRNAYVALGFLHAQDRFWQMELMRRAGQGRLSEVLGTATVKTDTLMRTLGLYAAARDSYGSLSQPVQSALQAYAAGVNAYIQQDNLPLEMRMLHIKPDAWQPADSLVWMKLMAYQLGGQWRDEITAARLMSHISEGQAGTLLGWSPINKPDDTHHHAAINWQHIADALPPQGPRSASNGWVMGGRFTADGMPQLANDPHLGLSSPILWYLARIVTPEGSVTGATSPGMPFHVLGQNDDLAWGITSTGAATSDLYIEHLKSPEQYITPNGADVFSTHSEEIKVKGADRVLLNVRNTRHGVVISDVDVKSDITGDDDVVALNATFMRGDDAGAEALYWINRAKTPADIEDAARFVLAPVQNLFFADKRGNYGMRVVGSVPVRNKTTGVIPADGTKTDGDWVGVIPRQELPRFTNPAQGYVENANESMVEPNYPYLITRMWMEPYRGERLRDLLQKATAMPVTLDTHARLQSDVTSVAGPQLRDAVLALLATAEPLGEDGIPQPTSGIDKKAYSVLRQWQGDYSRKSKAPVIVAYLQEELLTALLGDELGDDITALRPAKISILLRALTDRQTDWCDDVTTKEKETCAVTVAKAWQATLSRLAAERGSDDANWQWDKVNIAPLENVFWKHIPVIGRWVDNAVALDGGATTLKRADHYGDKPDDLFKVTHSAGYRGIYNAGNLDAARYVTATGQSANVFSADYNNQTPLWAHGESFTLTGTLGELQEKYGRYLTLEAVHKKSETK